jgi:hypothetical protein
MYAAGTVGPLHHALAPVMPYRAFGTGSDAARGNYFRPDAISVLLVPWTASQTTLSMPMAAGALSISTENPATCPVATTTQICGLAAGDQVIVFDRTGGWDVFSVDRIDGDAAMTLKGLAPTRAYAAGSNVTEAMAITYALKADPASGAFQLVRADGSDPAQPLLDHVVKLEFRYFGVASPPRVLDDSEMTPQASYGPAPPPFDESVPGWPAGENCTFAVVDGHHESRLTTLGAAGSLVEMPAALLTDGPWCPDAGARNRFDADLLRVRRVRFILRVQTALASLRGPAGLLFTHGGLSRAASRRVPDVEIQFDVTPRNLNLGATTNPEPGR